MTPAGYTEETLEQETTADFLDSELGWELVYTYNQESFGPNSLLVTRLTRKTKKGSIFSSQLGVGKLGA